MVQHHLDYGTAPDPHLEAISATARVWVRKYECVLQWSFLNLGIQGDFEIIDEVNFTLTPEKSTTARSVLTVKHDGAAIGDLYVILFAPGDATGKEGEYALPQFADIPPAYRFAAKPEKILPRNKAKEKVLLEACFPLGSVDGKRDSPHLISLEQITVDPVSRALAPGLQIGYAPEMYLQMLKIRNPGKSDAIHLTCGYRRNGERFGDPHATFYNPKLAEGRPNLMQVAGFLAIESADNPLGTVLDKFASAPQ